MAISDSHRVVHPFDEPPSAPRSDWTTILGGKGAGLARMVSLGLPVPPGFTIPTTVCNEVQASGWTDDVEVAVRSALADLEEATGRRLGGDNDPLLVSVRSGAPVSMPGMMDTVLNAGMSPAAAWALNRASGDERFGWDTYRRFVESYATVVGQAPPELVSSTLRAATAGRDLADVEPARLAEVLAAWRQALEGSGVEIPSEPMAQVVESIQAVFRSWGSDRAVVYRRREGIDHDLGTAVTVQAMVFGNRGERSGTGVAFTRDPSTGAPGLMGDFLPRAQGEDVVAGTHRTQPIADLMSRWPEIGEQLTAVATTLERDLADMVDIEFTVEDGRLWLLQARVGKRSPRAAVVTAVAMAEDPTFPLTRAEAVTRVGPLLDEPPTAPSDAPDVDDAVVLAEGLAASPGRAVGLLCVDPDEAVAREGQGIDVILVRNETSPADIHGMAAARGLVTALGGLVSHAAVVARSWGLPAVVGASELRIASDGIAAGEHRVPVDTEITVDGDRGRVLLGSHPGAGAELPEVELLRSWRAELESGDETAVAAGPTSELDRPDPSEGASGPGGTGGDGGAGGLSDEGGLRALALKGMATAETVAAFAGVGVDDAAATLDRLVTDGAAKPGPGDRFMLTPEGKAAVDAAYRAEAENVAVAIEPHLERFHQLNHRFKEVVTAWQMREVDGELVMNDHTDADHDAAVLATLTNEIHHGICAVIRAVASAADRLARYEHRLEAAVAAIGAGDLEMVANPLRDSYHTVWFELHEELIRLSGRNRADEAAAGRG